MYTSRFQAIVHQLLHLKISTGYSSSAPRSRASLDVTRFVASCTSLKSLQLRECGTAYLKDVVGASRAPKSVLETELVSGWNVGGTGVAELASILKLPAMADLKRWRMVVTDGGDEASLNDDERAEWEAACRARGAEPRDEKRFLTGESSRRLPRHSTGALTPLLTYRLPY